MKIQIIKIIPCLLAGFILSACVGAVNLAEGAVDNIKINTKTEEEPIVVDPQVALINRCTTKDLATDASCAPIVADHPCIEDPFGGACDITFTDYYKTAQANRISFCRENPTNNLCTGAIENVCTDNPLDADLCFNDNTYHKTHEQMCESEPTAPRCQTTVSRFCSDRGNAFHGLCVNNPIYEPARIDDCIMGVNSGASHCAGAFETGHCVLNPFGAGCNTQSYLTEARTNRVKFCDNNAEAGNNVCPQGVRDCLLNPHGADCGAYFEYKRRPNAASWLASFDSPLPKVLSTVPNNRSYNNKFLQGTATGLDFGDVRNHGGGLPHLSTMTLASNDLGGDSADGVAWSRLEYYVVQNNGAQSFLRSYFAGILSGTDLGERITETEGTAMWNGLLNNNTDYNFILTINFGAGDEAGQIESFVQASSLDYYIIGDFNSRGVITGTVNRREFADITDARQSNNPNGKLTGLIGQEGAVGAFISNYGFPAFGTESSYSGGFVARPPDE